MEGGCELRISQNFIPQIITPHDTMSVKNEMRLKVGMMIRYRYMIISYMIISYYDIDE